MSDVNFLSYADQTGVRLSNTEIRPDNPKDYSDILKLSNASDVVVEACDIAGGKEDSIDMNRFCRDVTIKDCILRSGDCQSVTIKGGCQNIRLVNVVLDGHGTEGDIVIGGWSDQSMSKTTGVVLENVTATDGRPVRVVVGAGDKPDIIRGSCKIDGWRSFLLKLYCFIKGIIK